jgi:methionyl-tRNA synthetase
MPENILIAIAWPYANAEIHVGNITGSHLPGDIVARYHRLKGNKVLMVSGTDSHGTPVTIAADKEGKPVEEVYKRYHDTFLEVFQGYGITYDLFTTTHTENHFKVSQAIFLALKENGFMFTQKSFQWYSPSAKSSCPTATSKAPATSAASKARAPTSVTTAATCSSRRNWSTPKPRPATGRSSCARPSISILDLSKLEPDVKQFLRERADHMRDTVLGESLRKIEAEGLKPRPITRDLDWGIPVPVEGWTEAGKRIYVWFEAVIGYLSAAIEWSRLGSAVGPGPKRRRRPWREWWANPAARQFYFIGKDNIFFHTSLWPAQLMGAGEAVRRNL